MTTKTKQLESLVEKLKKVMSGEIKIDSVDEQEALVNGLQDEIQKLSKEIAKENDES